MFRYKQMEQGDVTSSTSCVVIAGRLASREWSMLAQKMFLVVIFVGLVLY